LSDPVNDRLARHVQVDLSEARVARLWSAVEAHLELPRRAWRWLWVPALASALGLALFVAHSRTSQPGLDASAWQGARLETAADTLAVTLVDGSKLRLDPRSRVEVGDKTPSAVSLVLQRGRVDCDVTHREGRTFVVVASGVEVHVIGTHFSVANEQNEDSLRVEVRVERGTVEVRSSGQPQEVARVEAGHSWSRVTKTAALPAASSSSERAVPSSETTAAETETAAQNRAEAASPNATPSGEATTPRAQRPAPSARASDARELLEQASGLWREGRVREAAQAYQTLLSTYPRDPRAGLAAFELGRLRMDRLGDLAGAVKALERAVALAPGSSFREDALARLVTAYAGAHNRAGCEQARERYLREFPAGVRKRTVAAACGAP
jgi:TolA-binding protein